MDSFQDMAVLEVEGDQVGDLLHSMVEEVEVVGEEGVAIVVEEEEVEGVEEEVGELEEE